MLGGVPIFIFVAGIANVLGISVSSMKGLKLLSAVLIFASNNVVSGITMASLTGIAPAVAGNVPVDSVGTLPLLTMVEISSPAVAPTGAGVAVPRYRYWRDNTPSPRCH